MRNKQFNLDNNTYKEKMIQKRIPWSMVKLGDECILEYGKPLKQADRKKGEYPVFGSNGIVGYHNKYLVKGPCIIVGRKGTAGEVTYSQINCFPIDTTFFVELKNRNKYHLKYLYFLMKTLKLKKISTQSNVPGLNRNDAYKKIIPCPPLPEQKKIAAVLSRIQKTTEIQDKFIETTKELKQSTMKQLFTYGVKGQKTKQTEIGEMPKNWIVDSVNNSYIFSKKPKNLNFSGFKKISFIPMDLIPNDKVILSSYIEKSPNTISSGVYFESGDLLLSKITPSFENGKQCITDNIKNGFGIATTEIIPIKEKKRISSIAFLFYYLLLDNIRHQIAGKMEGTTGRKRVPVRTIKNLKIPFPPLTEQKEITDILTKIDQKIQIHEKKKASLEELFKTMLNKLMTGQISAQQLNINTKSIKL